MGHGTWCRIILERNPKRILKRNSKVDTFSVIVCVRVPSRVENIRLWKTCPLWNFFWEFFWNFLWKLCTTSHFTTRGISFGISKRNFRGKRSPPSVVLFPGLFCKSINNNQNMEELYEMIHTSSTQFTSMCPQISEESCLLRSEWTKSKTPFFLVTDISSIPDGWTPEFTPKWTFPVICKPRRMSLKTRPGSWGGVPTSDELRTRRRRLGQVSLRTRGRGLVTIKTLLKCN